MKLHYIMDPMCSWCYGFAMTLDEIIPALPADTGLRYVMGGLAEDSDESMPADMQQYIRHHWQEVAQRTGTEFNFDFWEKCTPRRATYPGCRAVIAAGLQGEQHIPRMAEAIQHAYYRQARNPSDDSTLIELAAEIGLDAARFADELNSPEVERRLQEDFQFRYSLGVNGFPALIAEISQKFYALTLGYTTPDVILNRLEMALQKENGAQASS